MGLIRLLLALSVVATHCGGILGMYFVYGQIAVQSFYIISGFYMSLIINEKYIGSNDSYTLFITNRFLRLFPIYWFILLLTLGACLAAGIVTHGRLFLMLDSYLSVKPNLFSFGYLILSNLIIFGQDVVMFFGINPENGQLFFTSNFWLTKPSLHSFILNPPAWTLALELMFYLIAPFILKQNYKTILVIMVGSLLLRFYIYYHLHYQNDPWTYRFFPTELFFFLLGYFCYSMYRRIKEYAIHPSIYISLLCVIIIYTFVYTTIPAFQAAWLPFSFRDIVYFILIVFSIPVLFLGSKANKLDTAIGELSYPIYISHVFVILICTGQPFFVFLKSGFMIAVVTIVFSFFLNRYIAEPFDRYRQGRLKR